MKMRNIYSRSKFRKIDEDSSTVKDVSNVSNSPTEIIQAWNKSLVGAVTNFFVGGILKGLKSIYKMGRKIWAMKNLSSKLNKEYLKGLIFFLDSKNIDTTGELTIKGKDEEESENSQEETQPTQVQDKSTTALTEIEQVLNDIDTIEEFNASDEIKDWKETLQSKLKEKNNRWSESHFKKYRQGVNNARNKSEKEMKQKILDNFLKGNPDDDDDNVGKEEFDKDFEQVRQINGLIDKKEKELTGVSGAINKIKKIIPDFNPTGTVEDFNLDYQKYRNLKSNKITKDVVAIGDKFKLYKSKDNKKEEVIVTNVESTKDGVVTVNMNGINTGVNASKLLPSTFPGFKVLPEMEKFLIKYGNDYNNLDDDNKRVILNVYRKYMIFKEIKNNMVEVGYLTESLLLEKQLLVGGKKGSVEGGDLEGNVPFKQILSQKDIDRLKNPEMAEKSVDDITYGEIIKKFKEMETEKYSPKTEVAKLVNKYNLEVIRLLADKEFTDDKSKKEWAKKVNRINAYWDELVNIELVNVLAGNVFSNDKTINNKLNKETSTLDVQDDLSVLENGNILGKEVSSIRSLGENLVIISFVIKNNGEKYILPGKSLSWGLDRDKKLVRVTTSLDIKDENDKKIPIADTQLFVSKFQKQNSNVFIGEKNVSGYNPKISTYLLLNADQRIPKDLTITQPGDIIIINEITYQEGSKLYREVCFFDFDKKRNYSIN